MGLGLLLTYFHMGVGQAEPRLTVENLELGLTLGDGRSLRGSELVGASLIVKGEQGRTEIRLTSYQPKPSATGRIIPLYRFQILARDGSLTDYCQPDQYGHSLGFPYIGRGGEIEIACTSGAIGKCVLWGLYPVASLNETLADVNRNACVRMVLADYGGDGQSWTKNGVKIRFCDKAGIHACPNDGVWMYEGSWSPSGAVCVDRARVPEIASKSDILERYPQIREGTACSRGKSGFAGESVLHSFTMNIE